MPSKSKLDLLPPTCKHQCHCTVPQNLHRSWKELILHRVGRSGGDGWFMQKLHVWTQRDRETADSTVKVAHSQQKMESVGYDKFSSSDSENHHRHHQPLYTHNRHNRMIFIMFGILSLFLLILTITVGVKFSQVNKQVSEVTLSLQAVRESVKPAQTGTFPFRETLLPLRGACEEDWTFYKGKCYFLSRLRKKWHEAEDACNKQRAHLLVVNDADELDYVSQIVSRNEHYWIGLVEREEGDWSWVDGTDFKSTEHFWDLGQPDDWDVRVNGEDCGQLHPILSQQRSLWNDADCTLPYRYICEGTPRD
ncbi:hepatic lectin-like [Brachyhypopomus gauderio]|uniref:hepatic lectin-like n=1 Tax=Brachyhypopomus gauderio TaxID=698409 RepID=UPI004040FC38